MRQLARLFLTPLLVMTCSASYAAFTDQTLLSIGLTVADADNDRGGVTADNSGFGLTLGVAKKLNSRLMLGVQSSYIKYDDDSGNQLEQTNAGIDLTTLLRKGGNVSPYVVIGAGYQRSELAPSGEKAQNAYADLGLGFFHKLNEFGLMFKADARLRRDFFDDSSKGTTDYDDVIFNIGVSIPLGQRSDAPSYEPMAEPQPFNDQDTDGVEDTQDHCPNTEADAAVDVNGCSDSQNGYVTDTPAPAPAPSVAVPANQHSEHNVAFQPNSSKPTQGGAKTLDDIVRTLLHRRELVADISAGASANQSSQLSMQRAKAMREWLYKQGVSGDRIIINSQAMATDNDLNGMVRLRAN